MTRNVYNRNEIHSPLAMDDDQFTFDYEPLCDYYRVTLRRAGYSASAFVSSSHLVDEKRPQLEAAIDRMQAEKDLIDEASLPYSGFSSSPV